MLLKKSRLASDRSQFSYSFFNSYINISLHGQEPIQFNDLPWLQNTRSELLVVIVLERAELQIVLNIYVFFFKIFYRFLETNKDLLALSAHLIRDVLLRLGGQSDAESIQSRLCGVVDEAKVHLDFTNVHLFSMPFPFDSTTFYTPKTIQFCVKNRYEKWFGQWSCYYSIE